jgi:hydrogenase 3 maturation protease
MNAEATNHRQSIATDWVCVMAVGNELRGDDGAGMAVGRALREMNLPNLEVFLCGPTPENYVGPVIKSRPGLVLIIDACDFGGTPGEWKVCPMSGPPDGMPMTHTFSLRLVADRITESAEARVWLVAIQPENLAFGGAPSIAVREAVETLARRIRDGRLTETSSP